MSHLIYGKNKIKNTCIISLTFGSIAKKVLKVMIFFFLFSTENRLSDFIYILSFGR